MSCFWARGEGREFFVYLPFLSCLRFKVVLVPERSVWGAVSVGVACSDPLRWL